MSRLTYNPNHEHWKEIDRTVRSLKVITNYGLQYPDDVSDLECYSGADWVSGKVDWKYNGGWLFMLDGRTVAHSSKKKALPQCTQYQITTPLAGKRYYLDEDS